MTAMNAEPDPDAEDRKGCSGSRNVAIHARVWRDARRFFAHTGADTAIAAPTQRAFSVAARHHPKG